MERNIIHEVSQNLIVASGVLNYKIGNENFKRKDKGDLIELSKKISDCAKTIQLILENKKVSDDQVLDIASIVGFIRAIILANKNKSNYSFYKENIQTVLEGLNQIKEKL